MNRQELVKSAADILRANNIRKPMRTARHMFHISDDSGDTKDFVVKRTCKPVLYNVDDIDVMLDACICAVKDALQRGECITVRGLGKLSLQYRKPRHMKDVKTGERIEVAGRYVPKFHPSEDLRIIARNYGLALEDRINELPDIAGGD